MQSKCQVCHLSLLLTGVSLQYHVGLVVLVSGYKHFRVQVNMSIMFPSWQVRRSLLRFPVDSGNVLSLVKKLISRC